MTHSMMGKKQKKKHFLFVCFEFFLSKYFTHQNVHRLKNHAPSYGFCGRSRSSPLIFMIYLTPKMILCSTTATEYPNADNFYLHQTYKISCDGLNYFPKKFKF